MGASTNLQQRLRELHFSESQRGSLSPPATAVHDTVARGADGGVDDDAYGPCSIANGHESGGYCNVMGMMHAFVWSARTKAFFLKLNPAISGRCIFNMSCGKMGMELSRSNPAYLPAGRKSRCLPKNSWARCLGLYMGVLFIILFRRSGRDVMTQTSRSEELEPKRATLTSTLLFFCCSSTPFYFLCGFPTKAMARRV